MFGFRIKESNNSVYCSCYVNRMRDVHTIQSRSLRVSGLFSSVFVLSLSPFISFYFSLSLLPLKCLKVPCHRHHGNCHFSDAETCSCLLFRHHCWLTVCVCVCMCVCVQGLCVCFSVCLSLCVSNQCFSHVYIFLLCCVRSILWRSLIYLH